MKPLAPGLGKGLGSLIPRKAADGSRQTAPGAGEVHDLPVSIIDANPLQPRSAFDEGLEELTSSIREHGILQPLVVQPKGERYELIAGERRFRAAKKVGLPRVPVIIRTVSAQQQLELALVENLQRRDLNPVEEATAYQRLIDEFNLTQEAVAQRVGKSRSHVANILRLKGLPGPILTSLANGEITEGHAKVLLGLPSAAEQLRLWRDIVRRQLPVRAIEGSTPRRRTAQQHDPALEEVQERLRERFQTRVTVSRRHGRGKIVLEYFSLDEFRAIIQKLLR